MGTVGSDNLVGSSGADTIVGLGGADAISAGSGDDTIIIDDVTFFNIDGGNGFDKLEIDFDLDLTTIANNKVSGIEQIDLGVGVGGQTLTLNVDDILSLSDNRDFGDDTTALKIIGETGETTAIADHVDLTGFTDTGVDMNIDGVDYALYTHDFSTEVDVLIQTGLMVI